MTDWVLIIISSLGIPVTHISSINWVNKEYHFMLMILSLFSDYRFFQFYQPWMNADARLTNLRLSAVHYIFNWLEKLRKTDIERLNRWLIWYLRAVTSMDRSWRSIIFNPGDFWRVSEPAWDICLWSPHLLKQRADILVKSEFAALDNGFLDALMPFARWVQSEDRL